MHIKSIVKKDKIFLMSLAIEGLILVYLLAKALIGGATSLSMEGEAFFDNIKAYDTISEEGTDLVFEAMPSVQQADLEHGVNIYSYEFALRSGAYVMTVDYESDGGDTIEYMLASNGYLGVRSILKESTPRYEDLYLDDSHTSVSGRLYIPVFSSVSDLQLFIHYDGPGVLRVKSISIVEKKVYRFMQVLGFLFCFIIFDVFYFFIFSPAYNDTGFDFRKKGRARTLLIVLGTVIFASLPLFMGYLFKGHDILFHLNRIESVAAAMQYHKLPIRIQSDLLLGFGYSVPLYYCDLFLYPVAFLYGFCMLPLRLSYQIYIFVINILTAYTSYRCFNRIFKDNDMALTGMMLYTLSAYRLTDIYLRAAVGEFTAFSFLPLVVEGVYRIYTSEKIRTEDWLPLAVGMGCIVQSHFMSTLIATFFILIFVVIRINKLTLDKVWAFVKAAACGIAMSMWFLIPMLESLRDLRPVVTEISTRIQWTGVYLVQLFELLPGGYGISRPGTTGDMPLGIGGGMTVGFFLILLYMLARNKDKERDLKDRHEHILNISFVIGTLALWMSTVYFPRDLVARLLIGRLEFIRSLWEVMELVWRHLTVATLLLDVSIIAFMCIVRSRWVKAYLPLTLTIVLLTIVSDMSFYREFTNECPQHTYIEMNNDQKAYMDMSADFDLVWGMTREIMDTSVIADGTDVTVTSYEAEGADRLLSCSNSGSDGDVILPLFDFGHYHAYDVSTGKELSVSRSDVNARLAVTIPAGFSGDIRVSYISPLRWRIYEVISLLCWLSLIAYGVMAYMEKK